MQIHAWEQLAMDQVVPRQCGKLFPERYIVFSIYSLILILFAFVVLSRIGCLWITSMILEVCDDITKTCLCNIQIFFQL